MTRFHVGGALLCVAAVSWARSPSAQASPTTGTAAPPADVAPPPSSPSLALPAPSSPVSEAAPPAPLFVQPATGVTVEFDSDRPLVSVFVAQGAIEGTGPMYPDPFVKLGRTPLSVKLAPGVYTVTVESPDITSESKVFEVGSNPVHVRVRSGSSGLRGMGTLLMAIGAAGVLAGAVIQLSHSEAADGISKSKITIPLFVGGGVCLAGGLTFYLTAGTTIEQDGKKPDRRAGFIGVTSRW